MGWDCKILIGERLRKIKIGKGATNKTQTWNQSSTWLTTTGEIECYLKVVIWLERVRIQST